VYAASLVPTKAILSPLYTVKLTLSRTFSPSMVLLKSTTVRISLPTSLSGLKDTKGYLRLDGLISSKSIFSNIFLREVACLDLDALALKRLINSWSCFAFSSFFLFWSRNICSAN